jgi:Immunity protein 21
MTIADESKWIDSTGGPLVLMSKSTLRTWHGVFGSSAVSGSRSDYERACAVDDYVGLIFSNEAPVIVLNQEPLLTTWYSKGSFEEIIVRCVWANNLQDAEAAFSGFDSLTAWERSKIVVDFPTDELVLFDSSESGHDLDDKLEVKLEPGRYTIETLFFDANSATRLLLHRLRR